MRHLLESADGRGRSDIGCVPTAPAACLITRSAFRQYFAHVIGRRIMAKVPRSYFGGSGRYLAGVADGEGAPPRRCSMLAVESPREARRRSLDVTRGQRVEADGRLHAPQSRSR